MTNHPDGIVARIVSSSSSTGKNHVSRRDLADLSLVYSRLSGDLSSLMQLLGVVVQRAVPVNLLANAKDLYKDKSPSEVTKMLDKWLKSGEGSSKFNILRDGLEAATIVAGIAALDNVDRRSINEDALQASIILLQSNLTNHLVPALSKNTSSKDQTSSPDRKRRRLIASTIPAKDLKKVNDLMLTTTNLQQILMERMGQVIAKVPMDVQQTMHLTTGAVRTLEMDAKPAYQLQLAAVTILTETFRRYSSQRDTILDELLSAVPDLPKRRSFAIRYSSATASTALKEFNGEAVGSLLSLKNSIHVLSAILLHLVQSCVVRPTYAVSEDDNEQRQFQSGLGTCQAVSDTFVNMILQRCRKAKSGSNTDSYRSMLSAMVEDWLLVLLIPEYPGARFLIASIQNILISRDLAAASSVFGKPQQSFEPTYLNTAFDVLAKICAVQARIRSVAKSKPVRITKDIPMSASSDQEVDCHCSSSSNTAFLIQCDHCSRIHHGSCVGIPNRDAVPNEWICDACCLMNVQSREQANLSPADTKAIDLSYVMHHSFQAMTSHRLGLDIDDAVRLHLALWVERLNQKKAPFRLSAALLEHWDKHEIAAEPLSDEGVVRVTLNLVAEELPFRKPISFLLKIMEDKQVHSLRKLALKVIDSVVKGDPGVMMMPVVTKAVSKRLSDESISVREGAVHLVGEFIAQSPRAIQGFHSALVPCLTDPGVSVRKRAVRIFEQILKASPSFSGRATVCSIMLERSIDPKEEDGVRDLIDNFFASLWLENGQDILPRKRSRSDESISPPASVPGLVTPTTPKASRPGPVRRVNATAEQMMEVVRTAGSGDHLAELLKKLLTAGAIDADSSRKVSERKKRQELGMDHCKQLIGALFELLVQLDEHRDSRSSSVGKDIAATLETIAVFCTVYPYPVAKHIETILPYFKADNGVSMAEESAIISSACKIISQVAPELEGSTVRSLSSTSLSVDLSKICYRFGQNVICKAVEAFSKLAQLSSSNTHFLDALMGMVEKLYAFLLKHVAIEDFGSASPKIRSGVFRGLTVLGNVCTHIQVSIEWEAELDSGDPTPLSTEQLSWSVMLIACFRIFAKYLQKKDTATRCQALSALKGLFLSQPQLLLNMDHRGLFDDVMSVDAPRELQQEALECWRSILIAEEGRIDSGEAAARMDADGKVTVSKRVSGDQNGDATVFGSVLNKHSRRLFEMMLCTDVKLRSLALDLMGVALRQGLVNPNEVVPHLFALQGDIENISIRSVALQLLIVEGEKRPDILRQRMRAGVKEAYNFQRRIHPDQPRVSALVYEDGNRQCIFSKIFEQSIAQNRKLREGLYRSLLKLFEHDRGADAPTREKLDVSMLLFVAEVLASLPYQTLMDPLLIIHHVSEIVSLQSHQICDRFADFLRPHGLASKDEFDDNIMEEDLLEAAARSKSPMRSNEAKVLASSTFDMNEFGTICKEGFVLVILIRLKGHLQSRYNLSIARCLEFDPSAKERPCDKALVKTGGLKDFDISGSLDEATFTDGDSILRHYALFRRCVRDDSQCNETLTEDQAILDTVASPKPVKLTAT